MPATGCPTGTFHPAPDAPYRTSGARVRDRSRAILPVAAALCLAWSLFLQPLTAQKYTDRTLSFRALTQARLRPVKYSEVLQVEGSAAFGFADGGATAAEKDIDTIDGSIYYHSDSFTRQTASIDVYAGRDGAVLSIQDREPPFGSGQRLELFGRYTPFYRDGFYENDTFVPVGQYGGTDWGMYLGVGDSPQEGLYFEAGPYFRVFEFDRTSRTPANYIIPDNHFTYGARVYAEQSNIALDRKTGKPREGYLLAITVEREQNESDRSFGVDPLFLTRLPISLWRGRGRFESYIPWGVATIEIHAEGSISDEDDRIYNYDAQNAGTGEVWIDSEVRLRFDFGGLEITPLGKYKYQRVAGEFGSAASGEGFFGGGLYLEYSFGDTFDIFADYSYLEDPNRIPLSFSQDTLGEHQLFLGGRFRLGATRSF